MNALKDQIREIVEIVTLVPEQFKATCFEMLLKEAIANCRLSAASAISKPDVATAQTPAKNSTPKADEPVDASAAASQSIQPKVGEGTDITAADIHMKVRKFLEKGDLTVANLNE